MEVEDEMQARNLTVTKWVWIWRLSLLLRFFGIVIVGFIVLGDM